MTQFWRTSKACSIGTSTLSAPTVLSICSGSRFTSRHSSYCSVTRYQSAACGADQQRSVADLDLKLVLVDELTDFEKARWAGAAADDARVR